MAMATRVTQASAKAITALKSAVANPGTEKNRAAAEAIIGLRRQFRHQDIPDWAGRSPAYRDCIEHVYREAGVPSDSGNNFQANLRYHLGNVLRDAAPAEDLAALGLKNEGPLGRVREAREADRKAPRARVRMIGDPTSMASAALGIVVALKTMSMDGSAGDVEPVLRRLIDESLDVIGMLHGGG